MAELNDAVKPPLASIYESAAPLLTKRGRQIVDRALKKGTVGGDFRMQLSFQPAVLLSLVPDGDMPYGLAEVARSIPFIGDYGLSTPCEALIAAASRVLTVASDPRADEVESWLSLPENEGVPGPVVVHQTMTNRARRPVGGANPFRRLHRAPEDAAAVVRDPKLRELSVMWAFGGSTAWPRTRINEGIAAINNQVADFLA
jgi:hypothetical protein